MAGSVKRSIDFLYRLRERLSTAGNAVFGSRDRKACTQKKHTIQRPQPVGVIGLAGVAGEEGAWRRGVHERASCAVSVTASRSGH